LTETVLADFKADVDLSNREAEASQMRVVLGEERLVFVASDTKHTISVSNVFDIAQDVPERARSTARETITIAFRIGERRATASVTGSAEELFKFQHLLFRVLLDGSDAAVRHRTKGSEATSTAKMTISVDAKTIRLDGGDDGQTIVVPRDDITAFKTGGDSLGDADSLAVRLYWVASDRPVKTAIGLPTPRLFNLFGRYVQSATQLDVGPEEPRRQTIEILLVDDDPDDLEMGEPFLQQHSDRFSITCTTSAAGGLDHLESGEFDCVISDFDMPGMNGIELLQQVRDDHPELPFILFTGQGSQEVAKQAIVDDVTDYVEKGMGTDQYSLLAERIWKAVSAT
jgi:CheY-like chemotaxis protein